MKKLALLIAVVMSLLTFSIVLATEGENQLLIAPAPEATEENTVTTTDEGNVVAEPEATTENTETT